jgi:hypothetical protein
MGRSSSIAPCSECTGRFAVARDSVAFLTMHMARRDLLGIFFCALSAAACAEPSIDDDATPLELPASYGVEGRLARALCAESFRVGDTVSAMLSPSPFSRPMPWPRHFRVLLRRDDPSRLVFSSVSADADGYPIGRSIGTFAPDVESQHNEVDRPRGECYPEGGRIYGSLSQPLRIPRMK